MREIDAAIDAIYQAAIDTSHWSSAMAHISILFGGRPVQLMVDDTRAGKFSLKASVDIDDRAWELAEAQYSTLESNPTLPIAMTIALDRAVDQAAMVGETAFRRSAVFADIYRPQGHWPFLGTVSARSQSVFGGLAVMRNLCGTPAERKHFQIAERMSVHIGRALTLSNLFDPRTPPGVNFQEALYRVNDAVLIIDAERRIAWSNEPADRLLIQTTIFTVCANVLVLNGPAIRQRVMEAIKLASLGTIATAMLMQPPGKSYVLRIQRLCPSQSIGNANLLVTIKAARSRARFDRAEAAALFGLTTAEARVACELCATPGIAATARELRLSTNTVKSLLRRCFEKTGVHTQSELAMLLATSLNSPHDA